MSNQDNLNIRLNQIDRLLREAIEEIKLLRTAEKLPTQAPTKRQLRIEKYKQYFKRR